MGTNSSKLESNKHQYLTSEEYQQLKNLFNTTSKGKQEGCNENDLTKMWEGMIDKYLLKLIIHYFFRRKSTLNLETFIKLFTSIVREPLDIKVGILTEILTSDQKKAEIPVQNVKDYVYSIISSYMVISQFANNKALLSWKSKQCALLDSEMKLFTDYLCQDLSQSSKDVKIQDLEMWVGCWSKFATIESLVYQSLYQLNVQGNEEEGRQESLIPVCVGLNVQTFPSIMDLTNIIFLNSCIPTELRNQWRFLFSTTIHGESFSKLIGSIVNQGPTLLIIEDKGGHVFGGFAPAGWQLGPNFIGNDSSFLFTLRPSVCVYSTTGYNTHYQYLNTQQQTLPNGLGMGGQFNYFGLWLQAEFGHGHSSETCTTYRDYHMLSSSKEFELRHVEVWGVGSPPKTEQEEEGVRSVLDGNLETKAMLEMVGKTRYSEGLREPNEEEFS